VPVISHITLGTNDKKRSATFYDAVLGAIGFSRLPKPPEVITQGVLSLFERRQAPIVPSTVLKVLSSVERRAVATTVRTAASPLADHMAR